MTDGSRSTSTYVIAEIGVNHDGDLGKALALVEAVAGTGADAVKIQTFTARTLVSATAPKAAYQLVTTSTSESQYEMLRRLELSRDDHWAVKSAAEAAGLGFLSTPYDPQSLDFLVNELGVDDIKIASSDITNLPLLAAAGASGRRVIVSTGMSTVEEIEQALGALAWGGVHGADPVPADLDLAGPRDLPAREYLAASVVLMQCTSQYPADIADANLAAIPTMRSLFGVPVGYSDHTVGSTAAIMSVALGSVMYEKHFTLNRSAPGPDHSASVEPSDFAELVARIREAESACGTGVKEPSAAEAQNRYPMRKSLHVAHFIPAGAVMSGDDIALMRPEVGDPPSRYWSWLGRTADRDYQAGEPLRAE